MKEIINTSYVYKNGTLFATGNTVVYPVFSFFDKHS